MTVSAAWLAAETERLRDQLEADCLSAELGCEVVPHPRFAGMVEARDAAPGVWLLSGTPDEVRDEAFRVRAQARRGALLEWLTVLGRQE